MERTLTVQLRDYCSTGAQLNGARHGSAPHGVSPRPLPASRGVVVKGALPHVYRVRTVSQ